MKRSTKRQQPSPANGRRLVLALAFCALVSSCGKKQTPTLEVDRIFEAVIADADSFENARGYLVRDLVAMNDAEAVIGTVLRHVIAAHKDPELMTGFLHTLNEAVKPPNGLSLFLAESESPSPLFTFGHGREWKVLIENDAIRDHAAYLMEQLYGTPASVRQLNALSEYHPERATEILLGRALARIGGKEELPSIPTALPLSPAEAAAAWERFASLDATAMPEALLQLSDPELLAISSYLRSLRDDNLAITPARLRDPQSLARVAAVAHRITAVKVEAGLASTFPMLVTAEGQPFNRDLLDALIARLQEYARSAEGLVHVTIEREALLAGTRIEVSAPALDTLARHERKYLSTEQGKLGLVPRHAVVTGRHFSSCSWDYIQWDCGVRPGDEKLPPPAPSVWGDEAFSDLEAHDSDVSRELFGPNGRFHQKDIGRFIEKSGSLIDGLDNPLTGCSLSFWVIPPSIFESKE